MIFREQIKQIFAREYHPDVPKSWKKWKYSGLDEEYVKGIEKTVLALLDNYKIIPVGKWQEIVELTNLFDDEAFFKPIFGTKLSDFKDLKMRFYKLQGWIIDLRRKLEAKVAEAVKEEVEN